MTSLRLAVLGVLALLIAPVSTFAAQQKPILGYVDESKLVTLRGNVRPEVTAANDRGSVEDSTSFHDLQLVLHRNPDAEADAELYFQKLLDPLLAQLSQVAHQHPDRRDVRSREAGHRHREALA